MRIGVCTSIDNSELLHKNGYDYIEMGLSAIAELSEDEFIALKKKVDNSPLKVYAFNVLFPKDMKLTGVQINQEVIYNYLIKALDRAQALGGEVVVLGSGEPRKYPDDFSYDEAFEQLVTLLKRAGMLAAERDLTIVIEPLRKAETNIINTASEGLKLAKAVNHPNVRLLVDFYHMACENEGPEIIVAAGTEYIKHLHIANPEGRIWPGSPDEANYAGFFSCLNEINYNGGISIEGKTTDILKDAPISMDCIKSFLG
jgi:D-psicose/D-tagatose/L-ribulose 3-epimerase